MLKKILIKSVLSAIVTAAILTGCSKDDDPKKNACLLTSFSLASGGDTYSATLTYDGTRLTKFSTIDGTDQVTFTLKYDADGNVTEMSGSDDSKTVYTYSSGNITREDDYEGGVLTDRTDYEYNGNGQLTKTQHYNGSNATNQVKAEFETYEYANTSTKNPSKVNYFSTATSTSTSETSEFTFDDKKHPYSGSDALQKFAILDGRGVDNNVLKETYKVGTTTFVTNYAYEYNANGYPTQTTATGTDISGSIVTTYTYSCN